MNDIFGIHKEFNKEHMWSLLLFDEWKHVASKKCAVWPRKWNIARYDLWHEKINIKHSFLPFSMLSNVNHILVFKLYFKLSHPVYQSQMKLIKIKVLKSSYHSDLRYFNAFRLAKTIFNCLPHWPNALIMRSAWKSLWCVI